MTLIGAFQIAAALGWLWIAVYYVPPFVRFWHRRASLADEYRATDCSTGFNQAAFTVRWLVFPPALHDLIVAEAVLWAALYIWSTLNAAWKLRVARKIDRALAQLAAA